jgi:hypothetical protein
MRKWFIWLIVACVVLVFADLVACVAGTHALVSGLDRWEAQARAQGWTISEGGRFTSGWPFAASVTLSDVAIAGGEHVFPGGVAWKSGRAVLSVLLASPFTLRVEPEGQETIRLSRMKPMVLNADRIFARVPLWREPDAQGWLLAQGVTGGVAGSGHPQDVRLESLSLQLSTRQGAASALAGKLVFAVRGIGLPDIGRWPLGDTVEAVDGTLQLSSPELNGVRGGRDAVSAWRDGGGKASLQDVALHWGPLVLRGEATLGLDGRLQPAGSGTADVSGAAAALDALVDAKVIAPGIGATGKAVLSVMPSAPDRDGLRLHFVLRDNTLSVGPIPLARLSDVVW